jgi:hypothetical protein
MAKTQWHPMFLALMRALLRDYYDLDPEVPVSDLPRAGDLLVVRRHCAGDPPFTGVWLYLADITEFEGRTDDPDIDHLDKLAHVGDCGSTRACEAGSAGPTWSRKPSRGR